MSYSDATNGKKENKPDQPDSLTSATAHYIGKLLRQNLDQLQSDRNAATLLQGNPESMLNALLAHLYREPEKLQSTVCNLERLTIFHQALNQQGAIHRQEVVALEQQIFVQLGFAVSEPLERGSLLLIDDTPDNLRLLSSALTHQGYEVRCTTSGITALKAIRRSHPDLILLDIMMPDMDGYAVCKELKADATLQDIPVIFISAVDVAFDKVKAFQMGGVDYITKPFQIEEVLVRVEHQLKIYRLQSRLEEQNIRLQQEIADRKLAQAETLRALEKEKEFNELRSRFISMVSHEFRTPLTTIQSAAELLEHYQWSEQERLLKLQQIRSSVRHMTSLLEDVLSIGKTEQSDTPITQATLTQFEVVQCCRELVADMRLQASSRHQLRFHCKLTELMVCLDEKLLRQILYNLLRTYAPTTKNQ